MSGAGMPELPELEILKHQLQAHVLGREVHEVIVLEGKERGCDVARLRSAIEGATLLDVERRGKMLILRFDSGFSLLIHLMMVGQLLLSSLYEGDPNDARLILRFAGDSLTVGQVSLKFLRLRLMRATELDKLPELEKLGPDPLSKGFTVETLRDMLGKRRGKLKSLLLNQSFLAGIGNTYADEILFQARIAPSRAASSLNGEEVERLHSSIIETLRRGLELGGSSEMAFVHLDGSRGRFQEHFQVKGRKGKPCLACGALIERTTIGGRGTYFCPGCQR